MSGSGFAIDPAKLVVKLYKAMNYWSREKECLGKST